MSSEHSVTQWLTGLKRGDEEAAEALFEKFFQRMVHVARRKYGNAPRCFADEEDAAQSAFATFVKQVPAGKYRKLDDRDDLRKLLAIITARKVCRHIQRASALKRGGEHQIGALTIDAFQVIAKEVPDKVIEAESEQACKEALAKLPADLRQVANHLLAGLTIEQIADKLSVVPRTISRKIVRIREEWGHLFECD